MNELTIINKNGQLVTDSREVADMIGKRHSDLLESIDGFIKHLTNGNFRSLDFFIPSTYKDNKGEERPCYLLTRKGCDMVANKMTGEKGVLFTAAYVTKFEEMEQTLKPSCIEDVLIQSLIEMKQLREQSNRALTAATQAQEEVQAIKDIIVINPKAEWRDETNKILCTIGYQNKEYQKVKDEVYKALEQRARCNLKLRLENLQARALSQGMAPSKVKALNNLDVIENDARLKEIYITIVKEMAIKYGVKVKEDAS